MRRHLCVMLGGVVLSCPTVVGAEPKPKPMPVVVEPDEDRLVPAVLHEVIDGDSVELFLNGRIIRYELAGADAPDAVGEDHEPLWKSQEAASYLDSLLVGEQLMVMADARKPTDAMGRARGYLYRMPDGLFVNLEMVRLGFAKHAKNPSSFNDAAMRWAQDRARDARKGVWSPAPERVVVPKEPKPDALTEPGSDSSGVHDPEPDTKQDSKPLTQALDSDVVYITKYGSKYHTKDCQHVGDSGIAKRRDAVSETHKACKVCEPDKKGED